MPSFRVFPNSDAKSSGTWTGTGAQFYAQLDEDPHDGDVSYIECGGGALTTRNRTFSCQAFGLPDATLITSVAVVATARRVDAGQNVDVFLLRTYLNLGGGRYLLASLAQDAGDPYAAISYSSATSPATGIAWAVSEVARLIPEIEISQTFDNIPRVGAFGRFTQLYADVDYITPTWTERDPAYGVSG